MDKMVAEALNWSVLSSLKILLAAQVWRKTYIEWSFWLGLRKLWRRVFKWHYWVWGWDRGLWRWW